MNMLLVTKNQDQSNIDLTKTIFKRTSLMKYAPVAGEIHSRA